MLRIDNLKLPVGAKEDKLRAACAHASLTRAGSPTSQARAQAPVSSARARAASAWLRYKKATRQPSPAKARTAAAPMPLLPPVMSTVRKANGLPR